MQLHDECSLTNLTSVSLLLLPLKPCKTGANSPFCGIKFHQLIACEAVDLGSGVKLLCWHVCAHECVV